MFFQCWLKKQKDSLAPQRQEEDPFGEKITWTSGLIFGKGEVKEIGYFDQSYSSTVYRIDLVIVTSEKNGKSIDIKLMAHHLKFSFGYWFKNAC